MFHWLKMEADQFCLQLQTLSFGAALKEELSKFGDRFESGACESVSVNLVFLPAAVCI